MSASDDLIDLVRQTYREWRAYDVKDDPEQLFEAVASRFAAHLLSDAAVERAAMVLRDQYERQFTIPMWENLSAVDRENFITDARANLRAAIGAAP